MRFFLALLLLSALSYGGYLLYRQSTFSSQLVRNPNLGKITVSEPKELWQNLESVLGESIGRGLDSATNLANTLSGGTAEPLINQAISNLQEKIQDLPQDQAKKIQYDYCKAVVTEYEKQ